MSNYINVPAMNPDRFKESSGNAFLWGIRANFNIEEYRESIDGMMDDRMDMAIIRVETGIRKIQSGKFLWFPIYTKVPVYRLVYIAPLSSSKTSYEEFLTHQDIFTRLSTKPIYRDVNFPKCIRINDFIDYGFPIIIDTTGNKS